MSRVGESIKKARLAKGMTPKELAKKCGVAESFVLDAESGRKVLNEAVIKKISSVLNMGFEGMDYEGSQDKREEQPQARQQPKAETQNPQGQVTDRWEDVFSAVIKKIPVYSMKTKNIIDYKAIPSADKKIEGYNSDKIIYVRVEDNNLTGFRLRQGDLVMTAALSQISKDGLYYIEYQGSNMIRQVKRMEGQRLLLISNQGGIETATVHEKDIKVLGLCLKAEISLL